MTTQLAIKQVDFLGADLLAVQTEDFEVYAAINPILRGMGLNEKQTEYQRDKWLTDRVIAKGTRKFSGTLLNNKTGKDTWTISLKKLPLALAKINITPAMRRDNPELSTILEEYQDKCADVLAAAFLSGPGSYAALKEQIKAELLQELRTNPQIAGCVALQPGQDVWCITWYNRRYRLFRERVSRVICDGSGRIVCYRATLNGCGCDRRRIYPGEIGRKTFTSEQAAKEALDSYPWEL